MNLARKFRKVIMLFFIAREETISRIKSLFGMTSLASIADCVSQGRCVHTFVAEPYNADILMYKPWIIWGFIQFEIIINVLVSSFRFI